MIILSSFGLRSPIISDKVSKYLNAADKKVLLVPFAGFDNDSAAKREREGLEAFGFKAENIYVCTIDEPMKYHDEKFDVIYIPGGNPFKLLREAQMTNIIPWLRELIAEGTSYFGVSSGADFLCEDISYLRLVEDNDYELSDYKGLGIIKENILCHTDQRDMGTIKRVVEYDLRKKTILIRNDEVYVIK